MTFLTLIWFVALALAAASLAAMGALIALRLAREREQVWRAKGRMVVIPAIVAQIGAAGPQPLDLQGYDKDPVLLGEVVGELARVVRGGARARLMDALRSAGVDAVLRAWLRRGATNQRIAACEALVLFSDDATRDALRRAQDDRASRVRLTATQTLIELGAAPAISDLVDRAIRCGDGSSLLFAELLRRTAATQIEGAIATLARSDMPTPVRIALLHAIGNGRDARALAPLEAATRAEDGEVRAAAYAALGALGQPDARDFLSPGLSDPDWRVRLKAVECVRRLGLIEFAESVSALASDDIWWVRHRAGEALMALSEQNVVALQSLVSMRPAPARIPENTPPPAPARPKRRRTR